MNGISRVSALLITFSFCLFVIVWGHNVSQDLTDEDVEYITLYLKGVEHPKASTLAFDQQIALIKQVQQNVLNMTPKGQGIPENMERRPKDLYHFGEGLCYDRSFVLELIFNHLGFETRHVSLFEDRKEVSSFRELTTRGVRSHAISEIKTVEGWLIIDSNYEWIGLGADGLPRSMKDVNNTAETIDWMVKAPTYFYTSHHHYIYGPYSRHGKFFPPYNIIPDYNVSQLLDNV
jgi:hypothetical protein